MTAEQDVYEALALIIKVDKNGGREYRNSAGWLHRVLGPAIALAHGETRWCLYGVEYSKYSYEQQLATLGL